MQSESHDPLVDHANTHSAKLYLLDGVCRCATEDAEISVAEYKAAIDATYSSLQKNGLASSKSSNIDSVGTLLVNAQSLRSHDGCCKKMPSIIDAFE